MRPAPNQRVRKCQHVLLRGQHFLHLVGNRVVGGLCLRKARSRGAKQVAQLLATALSRAKGIGIVAMLIGILQIEIIEVDAPIRLLKRFRIRISEEDVTNV
jgi:hypothetical protein